MHIRARVRRPLVTMILAGSLALPAPTSAAAPWTDPTSMTDIEHATTSSRALARTVDGDVLRLHAVFVVEGAEHPMYYVGSSNDGLVWSQPKRLTSASGGAVHPRVAASGSRIYAVWQGGTGSGSAVYLRRNTDHGAASAWKPRVRLTSKTGRIDTPAVAASGARVYILYRDLRARTLKLLRSTDHGATWRSSTIMKWGNDPQPHPRNPRIVASGKTVAVVWEGNYKVRWRISGDGGATWASIKILGTVGYLTPAPAIGIAGSRIAVAGVDEAGHTWLRVRQNGAWSRRIDVSDVDTDAGPPTQAGPVEIALRGDRSIAVLRIATYGSAPSASSAISWRTSDDGGATWSDDEAIVPPDPGLFVDAPTVLWRSSGAAYVTFLRGSADGSTLSITRRP